MGFKNFIFKKAMQHKLKNAPTEQKEIIMKLIEEHPELFEKIEKEVKERKAAGQDEMLASVTVMKKYQAEIQKILS